MLLMNHSREGDFLAVETSHAQRPIRSHNVPYAQRRHVVDESIPEKVIFSPLKRARSTSAPERVQIWTATRTTGVARRQASSITGCVETVHVSPSKSVTVNVSNSRWVTWYT